MVFKSNIRDFLYIYCFISREKGFVIKDSMTTNKKNQHYLPKFYLRNFSYQGNLNQIGLFNLKREFYFPTAPLKSQGSKNFFYGEDGLIEDHLSKIEGVFAKAINTIKNERTLPEKLTYEHMDLLGFIALTDLRNPVMIETMKSMMEAQKKQLLELDPQIDLAKFLPQFTHEDFIRNSLASVQGVVKIMFDLEYKLLINKTARPFISSDFPVVKYNQFLESRKWPHGKTGYGNLGLQIFIPINSWMQVMLYDHYIYKVGFKKRYIHELTNVTDIDSLNVLQFVNCLEHVYFDDNATKEYILRLFAKSKRYERANVLRSEMAHLVQLGEKIGKLDSRKKNFHIMATSDCQTGLRIEGIHMQAHSRTIQLTNSLAQMRPWAAKLRGEED